MRQGGGGREGGRRERGREERERERERESSFLIVDHCAKHLALILVNTFPDRRDSGFICDQSNTQNTLYMCENCIIPPAAASVAWSQPD